MTIKVLCICTMGLNRSKYIADYLKKFGYKTKYGGIGPCRIDPEPANPAKKEDMDWADIIITAREKHIPILENDFEVKDKKIIALEVSDSRKKAAETDDRFKSISREEFNKVWTYPKLEEALEKHLPLEKYF